MLILTLSIQRSLDGTKFNQLQWFFIDQIHSCISHTLIPTSNYQHDGEQRCSGESPLRCDSLQAWANRDQLPERKKWDKSEWEAKAKEKDKMYADRAKEAEAAMKEGGSRFPPVRG